MSISITTIRKFQSGNESAFEEILAVEGPRILSYIKRHMRRNEWAEDIFQEAVIGMWNSRETLREPIAWKSWIYRIARNNIYNFLRAKEWKVDIVLVENLSDLPESMHTYSDIPSNKLHRAQVNSIINGEVNELDEDIKEIFLLRFNSHLKLREISEVLNCPIGTINSKLRKGLKRLRKHLEAKDLDLHELVNFNH